MESADSQTPADGFGTAGSSGMEKTVQGRPDFIIQLILAVFFFTVGLLLVIFGLLSEMVMKTYFITQESLPYYVKEKTISAESTGGDAP